MMTSVTQPEIRALLDQLVEAESQAQQHLAEAAAEAQRLRTEARAEAEDLTRRSLEQTRSECTRILEQAKSQAVLTRQNRLAACTQELNTRLTLNPNVAQAIVDAAVRDLLPEA